MIIILITLMGWGLFLGFCSLVGSLLTDGMEN